MPAEAAPSGRQVLTPSGGGPDVATTRAPVVRDSWVTRATGARLTTDRDVATLGLRRNPRRAHLLVSSLLGKHVPVPAADVLSAAAELGAAASAAAGELTGQGAPRGERHRGLVVVGMAETATALGHGVAQACRPATDPALVTDPAVAADPALVTMAHTTRRPLPAGAPSLSFEEEHSHAVEQVLAVLDETALRDPSRTLVLVDDELTSGRTAVNAIRALHARWPRSTYLLASLLDVRSAGQRAANVAEVAGLGAELGSVSLADGTVDLPVDLVQQVAALADAGGPLPPDASDEEGACRGGPVPVEHWHLQTPAPLTGAHGWDARDERHLQRAVALLAERLTERLGPAAGRTAPGPGAASVLVLGDEEFLYPAQLLARALGPQVCTSSTTRSPALVVDEPGYPLRTALRFAATDDPERPAYAYNVAASAQADQGPAPGFGHVVLLLDRPVAGHTREGLLRLLAVHASYSVQVVVVTHGDRTAVQALGVGA